MSWKSFVWPRLNWANWFDEAFRFCAHRAEKVSVSEIHTSTTGYCSDWILKIGSKSLSFSLVSLAMFWKNKVVQVFVLYIQKPIWRAPNSETWQKPHECVTDKETHRREKHRSVAPKCALFPCKMLISHMVFLHDWSGPNCVPLDYFQHLSIQLLQQLAHRKTDLHPTDCMASWIIQVKMAFLEYKLKQESIYLSQAVTEQKTSKSTKAPFNKNIVRWYSL